MKLTYSILILSFVLIASIAGAVEEKPYTNVQEYVATPANCRIDTDEEITINEDNSWTYYVYLVDSVGNRVNIVKDGKTYASLEVTVTLTEIKAALNSEGVGGLANANQFLIKLRDSLIVAALPHIND